MIWVRIGMVKIGWPASSCSAMTWSRTVRVMSSSVLASRTTNCTLSSTNRRTSSSVMYLLVAVSYRRRLGYFLRTRGSLIGLARASAPAEASHHVLTTVAGEVGAGEEGGPLRCQKLDRVRHFLGRAHPAQGNLLHDLLADFLRHAEHHVGRNIPRGNGIHRDALSRDLLRQGHGEAVHPGVRRRVVDLPELTLLAVDGRDVDDPA